MDEQENSIDALSDCNASEAQPVSVTSQECPPLALNDPLIDPDTSKKLVEAEERTRFGDWLVLPHESEDDFKTLRKELSNELVGHLLGFGRQIAHEAAISRIYIKRFRLALLGNADRDLEGAPGDLPALLELEPQLQRQIDRATCWFEEDLALLGKMRLANESRFAMDQQLNLITAQTWNPVYRPLAPKISPTARRKAQVERELHLKRKYIDKENKLSPLARTLLGEPPIAKGESATAFDLLLRSTLDYCGFEKPSDVISAGDIAHDSFEIRRLLRRRDEVLVAAYLAEIMGRHRDRIGSSGLDGKEPRELELLIRPFFAQGVLDAKLILISALPHCLDVIDAIDRQIESIRARRARTIDSVITRRGSRLRLSIIHARAYRSASKAEWLHERWSN